MMQVLPRATVAGYATLAPYLPPASSRDWAWGRAPRAGRGVSGFGCVTPYCLGMAGLGGDTSTKLVFSAPQITGAALTAVAAEGGLWGMTAAVAVPVIGIGVAAVTTALALIWGRKGPRQKVATTQIVDKVEPQLKANVQAYLSGPRTVSSREQALANFYAGWQFVVDNCQIPEMGDPGQWCVKDRQEGACEWRDSSGQCWNWFIGYRDPILNDTPVPDPELTIDPSTGQLVPVSGNGVAGTGLWSGSGSLLLIGGLGLLLAAAFSGGGGK